MRQNRRFLRWVTGSFLAALLSLGTAHAQSMGGSGGGSGGGSSGGLGGGLGGGSSGGLGGGIGGGSSGGLGGGIGGSSSGIGGGLGGGLGGKSGSSQTGGSFAGGLGRTGSGTTIPTVSNPFATMYYSPYSQIYNTSAITNKAAGSFGQARYSSTTRTAAGGAQSGANAQSATGNAGMGFTTVGMRRTPSYSTSLSEDLPRVAYVPGAVIGNLNGALQRSRYLTARTGIRVDLDDGGVVVLSGQVASAKERRIAEGIVRLTPGVREVRNELTVTETGPTPRTVTAFRP